MANGCEYLLPGDPRLSTIRPTEFPVFLKTEEDPALVAGFRQHGGYQIRVVIAYGSYASGEAMPDSWHDYQVIVGLRGSYYEEYMRKRPEDFGKASTELLSFLLAEASVFQLRRKHTKSAVLLGSLSVAVQAFQLAIEPKIHTALNKISPNYYHCEIQVGDCTQNAKVVVNDLETFARHSRGGGWFRGEKNGAGYLYGGGRFGKTALKVIIMDPDPSVQALIYDSINQTRIDQTWMALALVPEEFDLEQLALQEIGLSYLADRRAERVDKVQLIYQQSPDDYAEMLSSILRVFEEHGFVEKIADDKYVKRVSLREEDVRSWLKEAADFSLSVNIIKNTATVGWVKGLGYIWAKFIRAGGPQQLLSSGRRRLTAFSRS